MYLIYILSLQFYQNVSGTQFTKANFSCVNWHHVTLTYQVLLKLDGNECELFKMTSSKLTQVLEWSGHLSTLSINEI